MEGHGGYNRSSRVQAAGLSPAVPLLEHAARMVTLPAEPHPIVIADYGSSEGRNSLEPITVAIRALRKRAGSNQAISVMHTDLPDNDFRVLFRTLVNDPNSYLAGDTKVFPATVGRSFYEQILPANSVTLGWSSWAVQWLSRAPAQIPDQIQVAYSEDPGTRAAFAAQAAADWRTFLIHRGSELHANGRLVVLTMAVDDAGDFGYRPVLDAMYGTLVKMVDENFISADELSRMTIPTVGRSRSDFMAPFAEVSEDGRFANLIVEELEVFQGEDRLWAEFQRDGDAHAFGSQWAAFSRASAFPTLAADLDGGGKDPRAAEFANRLEAGMAATLAAAPERTLIPLARMVFRKV
jgi:SAM dependent carboxyl methyltransferase